LKLPGLGCGFRAVWLLALTDYANMWLWALLLISNISAKHSSQDVDYVLQGWLK
jgi:hypothetical protein